MTKHKDGVMDRLDEIELRQRVIMRQIDHIVTGDTNWSVNWDAAIELQRQKEKE